MQLDSIPLLPEMPPGVIIRPFPLDHCYAVSTDCRLWTCKEQGRWNRIVAWSEMTVNPSTGGYPSASLRINGKYFRGRMHVLMLLTFVGPCPKGLMGRHLDGNPLNNRLDNLRWGTRSENEQDKERHGTSNRGERNGISRLTEAKVREIRRLHAEGNPYSALASMFGVCHSNIAAVVTRRSWGHVT